MTVLIATPTFDGNVCADYLLSLLATREKLDFDLCLIPGVHFADTARDLAVARFLESKADHLFFIDADLGWPDDAVARLIAHDKDVVGGAYPIKHDERLYPVICGEDKQDGLISATGLPGGFLCIKRRVLETIASSVPHYHKAMGARVMDVPAVFAREFIGSQMIGEDFMFCRRAREAGFELWLDPDISFSHVGTKAWRGNYAKDTQ
jgi:hypothetical protein